MNKTIIFLCLMIMIFVPIAAAQYAQVSGENNDYSAIQGQFNPTRSETCGTTGSNGITCSARSPGYIRFPPLAGDLNNDGTQETAYLTDNGLFVYSGVTLSPLAAVNPPAFASTSSNYHMQIFDIDGDGINEVIMSSDIDEKIAVYNLSSSTLMLEHAFAINESGVIPHTTGHFIFTCKAANDCMGFHSREKGELAALDRVIAVGFNSTGSYAWKDVSNTAYGGALNSVCFGDNQDVIYGDVDQDGQEEYYITYLQTDNTANSIIATISVRGFTGNASIGKEWDIPDTTPTFGVAMYCDGTTQPDFRYRNGGRYFSGPVLANAYGTGDVLIYAYTPSVVSNDLEFRSIDNSGTLHDLGSITTGGTIYAVSNPVVGAFRPSSDQENVCVLAWSNVSSGLITAGCYAGDGFGTNLLSHPVSLQGKYNLSVFPTGNHRMHVWETMIESSSQYQSNSVETVAVASKDLDELITTYGTVQVDTTFLDELFFVWDNPRPEGVAVMAKTQSGVSNGDYLIGKGNNVYYIDDNDENLPAFIDEGAHETSIDPCINAAWQINTSFTISVKVSDPESDTVSSKVTIYKGTANEQTTGWLTNASSGTVFVVSNSPGFEINKTISGGTISIEARDVDYNFNNIVSQNFTFNVGTTGVIEGDCITYFGTTEEGAEDEGGTATIGDACVSDSDCSSGLYCSQGVCEEPPDETDNNLTDGIKDASREFGVPIIFIILLLAGAIIYAIAASNMTPTGKTSAIIISNLILFGGASVMGLIGIIWIIMISLAVFLGLGITIANMMKGGQ